MSIHAVFPVSGLIGRQPEEGVAFSPSVLQAQRIKFEQFCTDRIVLP
jgi:hypothetical protein